MNKYSKLEKYLNFMNSHFKHLSKNQIILCVRYFKILDFLKHNGWKTANQISRGSKTNIQNTYTRLRKLIDAKILEMKQKGVKKFYKKNISDYYINKLDRLSTCANCGKRVGHNGGYLSENVEREPKIKILCDRKCQIL